MTMKAEMKAAVDICRTIDRFCRLQCPYGPAEMECLDCLLFEFRHLNPEERTALHGPVTDNGW
ncbi:MAG: hypothetical protein JRJ59_04595 [Deltaproteobacteria bacterium]|nr:hypothetical protein [Deltaproteobacteria bacterium]